MRHWTIATLILISLVSPGLASAIRVVDGDTVVIDRETIRILNIDTPEIRDAKCDAERRLGLIAKRRLSELLAGGSIDIRRGDGNRMTDRYGRTLAVISVRGSDVGEKLIADGLARPWKGKRQPWCQ